MNGLLSDLRTEPPPSPPRDPCRAEGDPDEEDESFSGCEGRATGRGNDEVCEVRCIHCGRTWLV